MTMVEHIARALCSLDGNPENAKMDGKPLWQDYMPEARAALEAMRSPTEAMIKAGRGFMRDDEPGEQCTAACWQAMLDAALHE